MFKRDIFSTEHDDFRGAIAAFLDAEIVPHHDAWASGDGVPRDIWRKAGQAGLLCPAVPKDFGGQGKNFLSSVVIIEALAARRISGLLSCLQSDIVAPFFVRLGNSDQKKRYLPGMCSGEILGAVAMTEAQSGSDMQNMRTTATQRGDSWVINGEKTHISNGSAADIIIVAARSEKGAIGDQPGITLLLVDANTPGLTRQKIDKSGMPALDTSTLTFNYCVVPAGNLLGLEGMGFIYLMTFLSIERLVLSIYAQSSAETLLRDLIHDCNERKTANGSVLSFQNTQFRLADLYAACAANRAFIDQCIKMTAEGQADPKLACVAKLRTTEVLKEVAAIAVQFRGANGISGPSGARSTQDLIDSSVQSIWGGTSEVMRDVIGRGLVNCL